MIDKILKLTEARPAYAAASFWAFFVAFGLPVLGIGVGAGLFADGGALFKWQSVAGAFVGGAMTIAAALIGARMIAAQMAHAAYLEELRRIRALEAERAHLQWDLDSVIAYTELCGAYVHQVQQAHVNNDAIPGGVPQAPQAVIQQLVELVRHADEWLVLYIGNLIGAVQTIHANITTQSYLSRPSYRTDLAIRIARLFMHSEDLLSYARHLDDGPVTWSSNPPSDRQLESVGIIESQWLTPFEWARARRRPRVSAQSPSP